MTGYLVTASPQRVSQLLDSLEIIWSRCDTVLDVQNGAENVEIANARLEQVKKLLNEDSTEMYNHLASRYASANLNKETETAASPHQEPGQFDLPSPPLLTGRDQSPIITADDSDEVIELKIYIKRSIE